MVKVKYIEFDGTEHEVEVEAGTTLMRAAVFNGVPGIDAECGGACACATCHVYVPREWQSMLPEQASTELDMLEFANEAQDNSRLSCQIILTDELDGLTVHMPEFQS